MAVCLFQGVSFGLKIEPTGNPPSYRWVPRRRHTHRDPFILDSRVCVCVFSLVCLDSGIVWLCVVFFFSLRTPRFKLKRLL